MLYRSSNNDYNGVTRKQKLSNVGSDLKDILKNTSIEIAILGVLGLGIGAYYQTRAELRRSEKIPLAFSEIGEVERTAQKNKTEVGAITEYELKVNDMCMKIFEAYNDAQYPFFF